MSSTFLFLSWDNPEQESARRAGYMHKITHQKRRNFSKVGFLPDVGDPGCLWLDSLLPTCSSPLDHLSVHCYHHHRKCGWAGVKKGGETF